MQISNFLSKIFSYVLKVDGHSIRREFKHAFSIGSSRENKALNEQELAIILKLAAVINKRKLAFPASMFLECAQPLNYIGSQMMVFFRPFLTYFFTMFPARRQQVASFLSHQGTAGSGFELEWQLPVRRIRYRQDEPRLSLACRPETQQEMLRAASLPRLARRWFQTRRVQKRTRLQTAISALYTVLRQSRPAPACRP